MDKQQFLISALADGNFHSGESLAALMGVSRTAIWKRIKSLASVELDVYSVSGKGHRLSQSLDLLDETKIRHSLGTDACSRLAEMEILPIVDSTNRYLFQSLPEKSIHAVTVLAEYQQSGKGRRGNAWISPYGSGLCLSLGWHFQSTPASPTALSLATGVAVCRCLQKLGVQNVGLKWPNDILSAGKKLGGILLESRSESAGHSDIVIGIGLNVNLPDKTLGEIEQPVTDLTRISGQVISRNMLAGKLIKELLHMLLEYQSRGFNSCIEDWRGFDELSGQEADLMLPNTKLSGKILGIDENGLLLMSIEGETKRFSSGELSLRVHT